mgnify:CR=1 FL=1
MLLFRLWLFDVVVAAVAAVAVAGAADCGLSYVV